MWVIWKYKQQLQKGKVQVKKSFALREEFIGSFQKECYITIALKIFSYFSCKNNWFVRMWEDKMWFFMYGNKTGNMNLHNYYAEKSSEANGMDI